MATTNLLIWNPTQANQESDAAYLADPTRSGGAVDPTIFLSVLGNKSFNQWSTYLYALFTAFAAKGFTTSDSSAPTLVAQCANFLTTADVLPAVSVVAYAATLTLNAADADGFYITSMTGNLTIASINGLTSGQIVAMYYQQDATGGRTVTFPSMMVGASQPDPAPNAVSLQLFGYDTTTSKLRAFGPLVSANGSFFPSALSVLGLGTFGSLTLTAPGTAGQVLTNVGGLFIPQNPVRVAGTVTDYSGGGRAGNQVYQNTSGGVMFIEGALATTGSSVGNISVSKGPSTPTLAGFGNQATATVSSGSAGFASVIPNSWFYRVNASGAVTTTVQDWLETVIS